MSRAAGLPELAEAFTLAHGCTVRRGPFRGLRYPAGRITEIDAPIARLLGAYECELQPAIATAIASSPQDFVDIGAADGYYVAGFLLASPGTRAHAFEIDPWARRRCTEMLALNGLASRADLHGACTAAALRRLPLAGAFVLCDCEGAEVEILDHAAVAALRWSTVLVELHDHEAGVDVLSVLERRFAATHRVSTIDARARDAERYPELAGFSPEQRRVALDEFRPSMMRWALFSPLPSESPSSAAR